MTLQVSGAAAAGAYNDFSCRPSHTHPIPVVMVHGAGIAGIDMATVSWSYEAPRLAGVGYCVFAPDYGKYAGIWGRDTVQHDAAQLKRYITRVLRATHTRHVSIISHSAGGAVARWYLKFLAGDTRVRDLVAIAPPSHVTSLKHACPLLCTQLNRGTIIRRLNRGGELQAGVDYTVIESAVDGAIVPYTAAFLHGPRRQLTNVLVQRTCPSDHADHIGLLFDPVVLRWVENALGRRGPANPRFRPCAGASSSYVQPRPRIASAVPTSRPNSLRVIGARTRIANSELTRAEHLRFPTARARACITMRSSVPLRATMRMSTIRPCSETESP